MFDTLDVVIKNNNYSICLWYDCNFCKILNLNKYGCNPHFVGNEGIRKTIFKVWALRNRRKTGIVFPISRGQDKQG